jgi:hypothetical protein
MATFMSDVASIAGRALETEDQELKKIFNGRGQAGGILRNELERYYQYIFWKAILPKYDAKLRFKHAEGYVPDLQLDYNGVSYFFEMKYWAEEHLRRIKADIKKVGIYTTGGYLVVFSANPAEKTEENLKLIDDLLATEARQGLYSFGTTNQVGRAVEFWVGIWHISSQKQVLG